VSATEHRGKARRKTVAGNIGNEHAEVGVVNLDEVVEIHRNRKSSEGNGSDVEAWSWGKE